MFKSQVKYEENQRIKWTEKYNYKFSHDNISCAKRSNYENQPYVMSPRAAIPHGMLYEDVPPSESTTCFWIIN